MWEGILLHILYLTVYELDIVAIWRIWIGPESPILYVCRGQIYEFSVNSLHPLHIHTAPFQLMQDLPADGERVGFLAKAGDFRDTTFVILFFMNIHACEWWMH